uniref:Nefa_Nip30_N domain-containing protein n=1 Tax=Syphacia muris TaxID=451379 RepID=A0A0N5A8A4_9BILA
MADRFVSSTELEEIRKRRQEEWEKVRKPNDPIGERCLWRKAPEEEVDSRSLYERLKEVRDKKQAEWEEEHKFKNMIRGLDQDETEFLSKVNTIRAEAERKKKEEEEAILSECSKVQSRKADDTAVPLASQLKPLPAASKSAKQSTQAMLIKTAIKRKSGPDCQQNQEKKPALDSTVGPESIGVSAMKVVGILPGVAHYSSSSDSDSTSDSNSDSTDDMAVLPVLIQNTPEKADKAKSQQEESQEEE